MRMGKRQIALFGFALLMTAGNLYGQAGQTHQSAFPSGLSARGGWGYFAIRDEYISREKYSGLLPYFSINWSRFHSRAGFRMGLEYSRSTKIKNRNVSAEITQFTLDLDYVYPIGKLGLFSREIFLYLGPGTELFVYFRRQNIAGGGIAIFNAYSFASLLSMALKAELVYPISTALLVHGSSRLSVFSIAGRIVDPSESGASPVRLLTPLSGLNSTSELSLRYLLFQHVSIAVGYRLRVTRISAWNPILSGTDSFVAVLTYVFGSR